MTTAPSLRVAVVHGNTGTGGNTATASPSLTISSSAVVGDYAVLVGSIGSGTSQASPATHPATTISAPDGWTLAGTQQTTTTTDLLTTAVYVHQIVAADKGSTVNLAANTGGRWSVSLAIVQGAASWQATSGPMQSNASTFALPAFTLPADQCFAVAAAGVRWPQATAVPAVPAVTGWSNAIEDDTTNTTSGSVVATWTAERTWGTGTSGTNVASSATASSVTVYSGATVVVFSPPSSSVTAVAGPAVTVDSFGKVTLTGSTKGGSGTLSSQSWAQASGSTVALTVTGSTATFTAPGYVSHLGGTLTFTYSVTDSNSSTSSATVTVTVRPARYVTSFAGTLKAALATLSGVIIPVPTTTRLQSAFAGGGGQTVGEWDPSSTQRLGTGSDTAGPRFSPDQTKTSILSIEGLANLRTRLMDGMKLSSVSPGVAFMTGGDSTSAAIAGCYVASGVFTSPSLWSRLDGTVAGSKQLNFNGGNTILANEPGAPRDYAGAVVAYPRHYGGTIARDDTSIPGFTLLHLATVDDGAWRLKVRNSDWTCVEQVQYPGTAGGFCRGLWFIGDPRASDGGRARLVIAVYNSTSPVPPLLCTNANATSGAALATASMTQAPTNVECMKIAAAPGASTVPLTACVQGSSVGSGTPKNQGQVYVSTNAHSAAAGSITFTAVADTSGNKPESTEWWHALGATYEPDGAGGYRHVLLVGTSSPTRITVGGKSTWHTCWRGAVPATSTTPDQALTWTLPTFSEQILGVPGVANLSWLAGTETPQAQGTAGISAFNFHTLDPSLGVVSCKGNTFLSYDAGKTWVPSNIGGSAEFVGAAWDLWGTPQRQVQFAAATGDWPLVSSTDAYPQRTFDQQGNFVLKFPQATALNVWFDSRTAECFTSCNTTAGGHSVPALDPDNRVLSLPEADLLNGYQDFAATTDWHLPLDGTAAGVAAAYSIMGGCVGYGSSPSSDGAICTARVGGHGLWTRPRSSNTWTQIQAQTDTAPYTLTPPSWVRTTVIYYDDTHHCAYFAERAAGIVWRVDFSANGTPSTAKRLYQKAYSYAFHEGIHFVDVDEASDTLWISTFNGVYSLSNASTAAHIPGTTDTLGATVAAPWSTYYPGEIPGPMHWLACIGSLWVKTQGLAAGGYIYPINSCDGPRDLVVASPKVAGNWAPTVADDWSVSRDRSSRVGLLYPKMSARNADGSQVGYGQNGSGFWVWRTI